MDRFVRSIKQYLRRAGTAERFVRLIVGGGVALVVGLWLRRLAPAWSSPWVLASALVLVGVAGLGAGIWTEIEY